MSIAGYSSKGRRLKSTARSELNKALGLQPGPSAHIATVRLDELNEFLAERGAVTDEQVAEYLNLGYGTVYRVRREGANPSLAFISALGQWLASLNLDPAVPVDEFICWTRRADKVAA